ncbi:MAG: hypothetical protein KGI59_00205 [Patescibacteria group bacterium]|nr:hypothetical protein [Patescibacteria group bacterium]MDE2172558.1 hypothetical protein [Patescibacteria group bacterium]
MKFLPTHSHHYGQRGLTLIETLLYSALLSFLVAGFIASAYALHEQDLVILDHVYDAQE